MPTLPDKSALGGLGSQVSGRGVPKVGDLTTGEEAVSSALGKVGGAMMGIAEEQAKQDDALGVVKAQARLSEGLHETERYFETDPDHKTFNQRYDVSAKRIVGEAADLIPNDYTREKWLAGQAAMHAAQSKERVLKHGLGLARQEKVVDVEDAAKRLQNRALDPSLNDDDRFRVLSDIDNTVEIGLRSGLLLPREGYHLREKYVGGTIKDDAERRLIPGTPYYDPQGLIGDLQGGRGFESWLTKRESSGRPDLVNRLGYAGLYQFGAPRLADLGLYEPGAGESLQGGRWSGKKWSGEFSIPGFEEVKTLADFRANPEAQKAAFGRHLEMMDAEIDKAGLDKYIGQKVGGVTITQDGLRAMLHLGGLGSAKRALESGGRDNPADENGTTVLSYANQAGAVGRYGLLTPQQRHALLTNAKIAQRGDIQQEGQDNIESLRRTGAPLPLKEGQAPYLQRASQVMTGNQISKVKIALKEAQLEYQATQPLTEMSEAEALTHIGKFSPDERMEGESYKSAVRVEAKASQAWKKIKEARDKDSAQAVSGMRIAGQPATLRPGPDGDLQVLGGESELAMGPAREVRDAISQIKQRTPTTKIATDADGAVTLAEEPGAPPPDQAQWKLLIEGRLKAQARLGIPPYSQNILTRSEAAKLLDMPAESKISDKEFAQKLRAATDRADAQFGTFYGAKALEEAMNFYIKKEDHRGAVESKVKELRRAVRREPVRASEIESERRLDELYQIESFFSGKGVPVPSDYEPLTPPRRPDVKPTQAQIEWVNQDPGVRGPVFDREFGKGQWAKHGPRG